MARQLFELDRHKPQLMAVLNVTPDSFSDGGSYYEAGRLSVGKCCERVEAMLAAGASIIDVGGESTRPGAANVSLMEEMDRVLPVLEAIQHTEAVISVDSSSPELLTEAARLGMGLINDIRALQRPGALAAAAATGLPVCLMHMQGEPDTMQQKPQYLSVLDEVKAFFHERIGACEVAGIARQQILLDPGFGFGKTVQHNAQLLQQLAEFSEFQLPLLVGMSRKSMIPALLGERAVDQRMPASLALAVMAVERGAWIVRAHDIRETADAINTVAAVKAAASEGNG